MTVTSVNKDLDAGTFTIVAEFGVPVERAWQLWSDPRQLEKWWGPPMWPATFVEHDLTEGGHCSYFMTGPEGEQAHGWWTVRRSEEPSVLEFEDGFADEDGAVNTELPSMSAVVTIEATDSGSRMAITTTFESAEAMETVMAMGMEEGITSAMAQIDGLLAA